MIETQKPQQSQPENFQDIHQIRTELGSEKKDRSRLWIGLIIGCVVLLVIGAVVQVLTPKKIEIPTTNFVTTNANNTVSHLRDIKYSGQLLELPNEFSLYSATESIPQDTVIDDLKSAFALKKPDARGNYWNNDSGSTILVEDDSQHFYNLILSDFINTPTDAIPVVDPTQAQAVATAFLKQTFPELTLSPDVNNITYLELSIEPEVASDPSKATGIVIPYSPTLTGENIPVVYDKAVSPAFTVTVDGKNTVRSMTFYPLFKKYTKVGVATPISVDQAITNMKAGTASIISSNIAGFDRVQMGDLTTADFTTVNLEYRQDPNGTLVYPFYHFGGTGTNGNGITAEIQVITPAVALTPNTR